MGFALRPFLGLAVGNLEGYHVGNNKVLVVDKDKGINIYDSLGRKVGVADGSV